MPAGLKVRTEVIVPFAGQCPHRLKALEFTTARYPWPVTVARGGEPWSKGQAVNPAVRASSADIIVLADADCATDGLPAAVEAVADGAPWAIPHGMVFRLTEKGTDRYMETGEFGHPFDRRPYRGMAGGGFVVAPRETLLEVPLDARFAGWGQEDESWALALTTVAGAAWRGDADLVHLFHPPASRLSRRKGSVESWALYQRYRAAAGDYRAMKSLIEEAKSAGRAGIE